MKTFFISKCPSVCPMSGFVFTVKMSGFVFTIKCPDLCSLEKCPDVYPSKRLIRVADLLGEFIRISVFYSFSKPYLPKIGPLFESFSPEISKTKKLYVSTLFSYQEIPQKQMGKESLFIL